MVVRTTPVGELKPTLRSLLASEYGLLTTDFTIRSVSGSPGSVCDFFYRPSMRRPVQALPPLVSLVDTSGGLFILWRHFERQTPGVDGVKMG